MDGRQLVLQLMELQLDLNTQLAAGQTTFSGADSNSAVLAYDAGFIDVYLNGVKLAGADYVATSGTSVILASGLQPMIFLWWWLMVLSN